MSIVSVYCECLLWVSIVSIVSVYCKCLLRLSIVSVYCKCLFCFRSKLLKNHWLYCVIAQKCLKTNGFIAFSLQQVAFLVRILVRKCIKRKKVQKLLVVIVKMFTVIVFEDYLLKNLQRERFFWNSNRDRRPSHGDVASRFVCVFLCSPLFEPKWEPSSSCVLC